MIPRQGEHFLWSGLSLHHTPDHVRGLGARRQVSTPSRVKGLARDCHLKGFPEFDEFYSLRFRRGTQI